MVPPVKQLCSQILHVVVDHLQPRLKISCCGPFETRYGRSFRDGGECGGANSSSPFLGHVHATLICKYIKTKAFAIARFSCHCFVFVFWRHLFPPSAVTSVSRSVSGLSCFPINFSSRTMYIPVLPHHLEIPTKSATWSCQGCRHTDRRRRPWWILAPGRPGPRETTVSSD
jgi:hypothetical protein